MRVFLSWSGETSRAIAEVLREWLPSVLQAVEPWMSAEDIHKGSRWNSEMSEQLSETKAGIVCLTLDNLKSPWIHFEAGALSKTIERTLVCPYLFGVKPTDLSGPLVQFQAAECGKRDTERLVKALNKALGPKALADKQFEKTFEHWWPDLEKRLATVPQSVQGRQIPARRDRELIEEILTLVRALSGPQFNELLLPSAPRTPPTGTPPTSSDARWDTVMGPKWAQQTDAERLRMLQRLKSAFPEIDVEGDIRTLTSTAKPTGHVILPKKLTVRPGVPKP